MNDEIKNHQQLAFLKISLIPESNDFESVLGVFMRTTFYSNFYEKNEEYNSLYFERSEKECLVGSIWRNEVLFKVNIEKERLGNSNIYEFKFTAFKYLPDLGKFEETI